MKISRFIDHTLLKPDATSDEIDRLCEEAEKYGFFSVCVNGNYVGHCRARLRESRVKIATVVGFPLGASHSEVKRFEAECALESGADEIDMVVSISDIKNRNWNAVYQDIRRIKEQVSDRILKVIIETTLLTSDEKKKCCEICLEAHADFVKTSTGFQSGGATVADIELIRSVVGTRCGIKASGGIRTYSSALAMIHAGATRLGLSKSVDIMREAEDEESGLH